MPLWSSTEANTGVPKFITMQVNKAVTQANTDLLYQNNTTSIITSNANVGVFGVNTNEVRAARYEASSPNTSWGGNATANVGRPGHAGWVLRTVGTGLRAGRVTYETMVAMGSMTGDGGDDAILPDYSLNIYSHPTDNTAQSAVNVHFTVGVVSVPSGQTLTYKWHKAIPPDNNVWVALTDAGIYANTSTINLDVANNVIANANTFRCMITGANVKTANTNSARLLRLP